MDTSVVSDYFQPSRVLGGHAPFALSWMTAVGERTKRITLGTSVLAPTFRYNPAVTAQAFATMACLYPAEYFLVSERARRLMKSRLVSRMSGPRLRSASLGGARPSDS
ncbi:F420-dependent glucose-6-phosphate dehydrogenase Fgd1 [Mycobacteroides abscessus]|nr:F420-dependent glucose-6-phosphate dehydrogenase Fgd1 [Mycobacteroides abscessus]CPS45564.1 F420-dependent glucose-6-phosphate dehydrogenase Fgd1 [Mycobacteroides abscessus]CPS54616.1 F420-dependent glucose-6-phosphate dehydrogenase Fgd1 [Mycobacteroides abscessus]CPT37386.1 F420-dependent glucose-6-phosphate dehydrogenase Fgd1 [Mycobacteroides abscessus]CPT64442.1 F420-dependent glucose-6-phosphate dehydrogenase Fgd1 [Mycobacteroides abscessus]